MRMVTVRKLKACFFVLGLGRTGKSTGSCSGANRPLRLMYLHVHMPCKSHARAAQATHMHMQVFTSSNVVSAAGWEGATESLGSADSLEAAEESLGPTAAGWEAAVE